MSENTSKKTELVKEEAKSEKAKSENAKSDVKKGVKNNKPVIFVSVALVLILIVTIAVVSLSKEDENIENVEDALNKIAELNEGNEQISGQNGDAEDEGFEYEGIIVPKYKGIQISLEPVFVGEDMYVDDLNSIVWSKFLSLIKVVEFNEDEIQEMIEVINKSTEEMAASYDLTYEQMISLNGVSIEEHDMYTRESVEIEYMAKKAVEYIANREKLVPSQDLYDEKIKTMLKESGYISVQEALNEGWTMEELEWHVLTEIVVNWIANYAEIID